ncbi:hypothetical protein N8482_01730 [Chitinophagales bacterium]|nr:hypothetical protein [Chitinophagales bacterium]
MENNKETKYRVSGKIEHKLSYCGGARPSPETIKKYKAPRPLEQFKIYIKHGTKNTDSATVVDSTVTNDLGEYSFSLPPGEYILLGPSQLNRPALNQILNQQDLLVADENCLEKWFAKGLLSFVVKDRSITELNHLIIKKCNVPEGIPCLRYTGKHRP